MFFLLNGHKTVCFIITTNASFCWHFDTKQEAKYAKVATEKEKQQKESSRFLNMFGKAKVKSRAALKAALLQLKKSQVVFFSQCLTS